MIEVSKQRRCKCSNKFAPSQIDRMIDGMSVKGREQSFKELQSTCKKTTINNETGEVEGFNQEIIKGIRVNVLLNKKKGRGNKTYRGSIHSFFHNANYTRFTFSDFLEALISFENTFGVSANELIVQSFEFGVNIETDKPPTELFYHFVHHKQKFFSAMDGRNDPKGIKCEHDAFTIKIYDKGGQYRLDRYLLRIEIKVRKMTFARRNEIIVKHLSDLANREVWQKLSELLVRVYDEVFKAVRVDIPTVCKERDRELLDKGFYPMYWKNISEQGGNKRGYLENKYKKLIEGLGAIKVFDEIRQKIIKECQELIKSETASIVVHSMDKNSENTPLLEYDAEKEKFREYTRRYGVHSLKMIEVIDYTPSEAKERELSRLCVICCKDISHKRKNAKYCDTKCKNAYNNAVHNPLRKTKRQVRQIKEQKENKQVVQGELFDSTPYLKVTTTVDAKGLIQRREAAIRIKGLIVIHTQKESKAKSV